MKKIQMKCRTCGKKITRNTGIPAGYCNECVDATDKLVKPLDKMIPSHCPECGAPYDFPEDKRPKDWTRIKEAEP